MQLLSVACVSVAAKMEETHVPSLLDLQILDQRYVFDPHTVGRMELLLMTALGWRMRAITPFDFLPHLVPSCPSALLSRAADLILSSVRGIHPTKMKKDPIFSPLPNACTNWLYFFFLRQWWISWGTGRRRSRPRRRCARLTRWPIRRPEAAPMCCAVPMSG